ncbi:hypothetical protein F4779DRAFT_618139 [Xylariaceae sp. FL0662B]|nr:hypothetical protein F4779DRAFT_618139 [Xylariaceae sp. FL0662B]
MDSNKAATTTPSAPSPVSKRRGSGPSFNSLVNEKRSNDPSSMARRASLHDQQPQAGFFGKMWHNFTRGPSSPTK